MRDVNKKWVAGLAKDGTIKDTSILCLCASDGEEEIFQELGFTKRNPYKRG